VHITRAEPSCRKPGPDEGSPHRLIAECPGPIGMNLRRETFSLVGRKITTTRRWIAAEAALVFALCGCASVEPNATLQAGVAVPATWSVVDVGTDVGSTSLVGWWFALTTHFLRG